MSTKFHNVFTKRFNKGTMRYFSMLLRENNLHPRLQKLVRFRERYFYNFQNTNLLKYIFMFIELLLIRSLNAFLQRLVGNLKIFFVKYVSGAFTLTDYTSQWWQFSTVSVNVVKFILICTSFSSSVLSLLAAVREGSAPLIMKLAVWSGTLIVEEAGIALSVWFIAQGWRTFGTRAQNGTPKDFLGTRCSLLSQVLFYFFCPTRVTVVWRICVNTYTYV
jgi:hypothetical protein